MHKQSQRQERTKRIICRFKDLGCLREALNSGLSVDGRAGPCRPLHLTLQQMSPGLPRPTPSSGWLCLCIISSEGSTSPDNPGGGVHFPSMPHMPLHTQTLAICSLLTPSSCCFHSLRFNTAATATGRTSSQSHNELRGEDIFCTLTPQQGSQSSNMERPEGAQGNAKYTST